MIGFVALAAGKGIGYQPMKEIYPRIKRERETIERMLHLYCHDQHGSEKGALCTGCRELMDYAEERLNRCPFQERKSVCAKCLVHCYKPVMREKVRVVMRYAGPRMLLRHPALTIMHLIDGRRKPPILKRKDTQG